MIPLPTMTHSIPRSFVVLPFSVSCIVQLSLHIKKFHYSHTIVSIITVSLDLATPNNNKRNDKRGYCEVCEEDKYNCSYL